jgi:hypothetical protein
VENEITKKYFLKEYHKFREIMCSGAYDLEQKLDAFQGLVFVYMNITPNQSAEDEQICQTAMMGLNNELNMRLGYDLAQQCAKVLEENGVDVYA